MGRNKETVADWCPERWIPQRLRFEELYSRAADEYAMKTDSIVSDFVGLVFCMTTVCASGWMALWSRCDFSTSGVSVTPGFAIMVTALFLFVAIYMATYIVVAFKRCRDLVVIMRLLHHFRVDSEYRRYTEHTRMTLSDVEKILENN
jgi:hypothetical protein